MLIIILIAVSLSMDAFSLSLLYGTLNLSKKDIISLSIIVGIYHFIMPLLGFIIGYAIHIESHIIIFILLTIIGLQMIFNKNEEEVHYMSYKDKFLFGLAVSLDSFSVGIVFSTITTNYIISALIFALFSFTFTMLGLKIGKQMNNKFGKISTIIGGIMLIIIGIVYLIK